jgi:hypothetical protein
MVMLTLGAAVFSGLFTLSYGYAIHAPHPHDVPVDVVAPAAAVARVRAGLATAVPGGFDVRSRTDEADARRDIADTSSYGALVVPRGGPLRVLTAGADGVPVQQVVTSALDAVAHGWAGPSPRWTSCRCPRATVPDSPPSSSRSACSSPA